MKWPVIVLDGALRNQTLSSIQFDKHGNPTQQEIFICDNWVAGFDWATQNNYEQALFVKSGTMFTDWNQWKSLIDNYPHYGLIAHLIWRPGNLLCLDDQCWFINVKSFTQDDLTTVILDHPCPVRNDQNVHDDYTPLWVTPGTEQISYTSTGFGQGLIARQLKNQLSIVNWNNRARDLKFYLYDGVVNLDRFKDYKDIAENQLWVFNNEPINIINKQRLVSPGSGLSWMLNIVSKNTVEMCIVDISKIQIQFCQRLWEDWNGSDYGNFVWNFMQQNHVIHYQLDDPGLTPLQKLSLKKQSTFVDYVNNKFEQLTVKNFSRSWQHAQQTKSVKFVNDNLISWAINNNIDAYDHVWCSNILNYKWTLLHTTVEQYDLFQSKIR